MSRGQTTLDFAIGVSLFILVLLFVFTFIPGTLQPFTQGAQEETVASNRVADLLVKDLLVEDERAYVVDGHCTAVLLGGLSGSGTDCGFDGGTLAARLDLPDRQFVNVTIHGNVTAAPGDELLCWDDSAGEVVAASDSSCDTVYTGGGNAPEDRGSTVTSRRIVSIEGVDAALEVRMW
jgi:hypothetical protein